MLELPDMKTAPDIYLEKVERAAKQESWAVLMPIEYYFARKALRGGRTDVRKLYHAITPEQYAAGERICYQDICSEYPFQQVEHDFPVGTPEIRIYDRDWTPCSDQNHQDEKCLRGLRCGCEEPKIDRKCNLRRHFYQQPTEEEMLSRDFFGIVCASVTPPKNLYHPVLVYYDDKAQKCISSCEPIKEGVFTTVELQRAIQRGYKIDKIHRLDKYTRKASLWRDTTFKLFIEKMVNSKNEPGEEEAQRLIDGYERKFGMGDEIAATFQEHRWGKNPAKKQTAKIMMNSVWGKHAERLTQIKTEIFDRHCEKEDVLSLYTFYHNVLKNNYQVQGLCYMGNDRTLIRYQENASQVSQNMHKTYLPAAVFVPAYGRLQLEEQLFKLGKRVLMNDTDSIVYHYIPGAYNIPEGDLLGDWEVEDFDSKNGGILEFVGMGPKTYAMRAANGKTTVKAKGVSVKYAHNKLVNFQTMRDIVFQQIRNPKQPGITIKVPQLSFKYTMDSEMRTERYYKGTAHFSTIQTNTQT